MTSDQERKLLFTPGPLCTTMSVKKAMLRDIFPRGDEFNDITQDIMQRILRISGAPPEDWSVVLTQGTGTYGLESVVLTVVPKTKDAKVLVLHNGFYASRMTEICQSASIPYDTLKFGEDKPYDLKKVEKILNENKYSLVVTVHCETSNGILNPVEELSQLVRSKQPSAAILVDTMSSFSAIPLTFKNIDFIVGTPNKVMQSVPGFTFILARSKRLEQCKGNTRTLTLDLLSQYEALNRKGQFRFTPPSHVMLAAQQALIEYEAEGGPTERRKRYQSNATTLVNGLKLLGFKMLLPDEHHSPIVTSVLFPKHSKFSLEEFCRRLDAIGLVLFPGKLTIADSFRVGTMGDIYPKDVERLLKGMEQVLKDMGIPVPVP